MRRGCRRPEGPRTFRAHPDPAVREAAVPPARRARRGRRRRPLRLRAIARARRAAAAARGAARVPRRVGRHGRQHRLAEPPGALDRRAAAPSWWRSSTGRAALNLNAVVLQVRPAADALYASRLEPWSEYLTGDDGARAGAVLRPARVRGGRGAPARARAARVVQPLPRPAPVGAKSPVARQPHQRDAARPGAALRADSLDGPRRARGARRTRSPSILDVVRRYDVDGVHIDDYFYPYKEKRLGRRQASPSPTTTTWARVRSRRRQAGPRRLAPRQRRTRSSGACTREVQGGEAVGEGRHQPVRHLAARAARRDRRLRPVRQAVRRRAKLAATRAGSTTSRRSCTGRSRRRSRAIPQLLDWWAARTRAARHLWPGNCTPAARGRRQDGVAGEEIADADRAHARAGRARRATCTSA